MTQTMTRNCVVYYIVVDVKNCIKTRFIRKFEYKSQIVFFVDAYDSTF